MTRAFAQRFAREVKRCASSVRSYFEHYDPSFRAAFLPALIAAAVLFIRSPASNYIFDEQEALLANPYVNGRELGFFQVLERDFWGLPADRSIGSYRPIPNVIWRAIWQIHPLAQNPWLLHVVNVVVHAVNAALIASLAFRWTASRRIGWLAGTAFVVSALLTETVSGVVGLADVLGGLGLLLALAALAWPIWAMPFGVFGALTLGFFSKESTLVALPIVFWAALITAPLDHRSRPIRGARALGALLAAALALVLYTEVRRHFFPVSLPAELAQPLAGDAPLHRRALHAFLRWFAQPRLPHDPINNPLVRADVPRRVAGALAVYAKGLGQVVFPWTLSGDYSFAAEPVPKRVVSPLSVLGGLFMIVPPIAGIGAWVWALLRERRGLAWARFAVTALVLVWIPVAYFPHSNIAVLLPTVRAERFWYVPVVGASFGIGMVLAALSFVERRRPIVHVGWALVGLFIGFQAMKSRLHALDYSNDLAFWRATARATPRSAKAHLNYGVMLGARQRLDARLVENRRAMEIAPEWPMAHVYFADTLCRLGRYDEAWPHYVRGFSLGPNDRNLIALGLQCLWDGKALEKHHDELLELANEEPGTWLAYLARDIVYNGDKHKGVDPQYRPRGYDEGPKKP